jgi:hypothetical protein
VEFHDLVESDDPTNAHRQHNCHGSTSDQARAAQSIISGKITRPARQLICPAMNKGS